MFNIILRAAVLAALFASVEAQAALPLGVPEVTAAGTWTFSTGHQVSLFPNGSAYASNDDKGAWKLDDPAARRYVISWRSGARDTMVLAKDAARLEGSNGAMTITGERFIDPITGIWSLNEQTLIIRSDAVIYRNDGTRGTWKLGKVEGKKRSIAVVWESGDNETWVLRDDGVIEAYNRKTRTGFTLKRTGELGSSFVVGTFRGSHPHWGDTVSIAADGTYRRGNGDPGVWSFDGRTLTLHWKNWGPEPVVLQLDGSFASPGGFRLVRAR
jgi:hypothetical protein